MNLNFLKIFLFSVFLLMNLTDGLAQVAINGDGSAPAPSAMLEVVSTDKGMLIPRMSEAQRDNISDPANGLLIYQTNNTSGFYYFTGTAWQLLGEKGDTGDAGAKGEKGDTGDAGVKGEKGDTGDAGAKGDKGDTGDAGVKGDKGDTGEAGAKGEKGDTGDAGAKGEKGDAGDAGAKGEKGDTGDAGATGPQGPAADQTLTEVLTSGNSAGSSTINMNSNKITSLATPTADTDAATKKYVDDNGGTGTDDQTLTEVLTSGNSAGSSTINMNTNKITNLASPTADTDAATKKYVDETAVELPNSPTAGTMAYWDGSAWSSIAPGSQDQTLTNCGGVPTWGPCPVEAPEVGDFYEGGVVFHIFVDGETGYVAGETHGLIAAPMDQSSGIGWGCFGTDTGAPNVNINPPSGLGAEIGDGATNTAAIVAGCMDASFAAKLCADLDLGGFTDWFLPSAKELNLMYQNKATIDETAGDNSGSDFSGFYWSSTESDGILAWLQGFNDGGQGNGGKFNSDNVRAVRAF